MAWILDFDDTLALGPNTWAFETVLPELIQKYNLPFEPILFAEVTLKAQEESNLNEDEEAVLRYVFDSLGWPLSLKDELIQRVFGEYQPKLFDDTLPFLERMKAKGDLLFIVSNNAYAPYLAEQLGIAQYFTKIFTPKNTEKRSKPHHGMWEAVVAEAQGQAFSVVGDDPWSDGLFSQKMGDTTCWILDRLGRYKDLELPYRFAVSLDEIV